ncbi:hypothetical protein J2T07_000422 [Luteibacter jiangsuensis]|uniref:Glycosyltransferase 2-like domain-containing protein n=1 Tax=Luteibacter jiangsuensis TaxID=637577 RepID=A0ABT9STD3_9GAMM|nr:hypothetical protein [Luteibacter jiangsuensis]MDQ0008263.1 hypothetical protein [Luteibacter jiangsuensis]
MNEPSGDQDGWKNNLAVFSAWFLAWTSVLTLLVVCPAWATFGTSWLLVVLVILTLIAVGDAAWDITAQLCRSLPVQPHLPSLELASGIPEASRTLVAVPSLVVSLAQADRLVADLELRMIGNRQHNLLACLVVDFADATTPDLTSDEVLLARLREAIAAANARRGGGFFLFHRKRAWNSQDARWMGRERKRGKIEDLNSYLLGEATEGFGLAVGTPWDLGGIAYVIVLDEDTPLPPGGALRLIGTISHPANQPVVDSGSNTVIRGHGVIQPIPWVTVDRARSTWSQSLSSSSVAPAGDLYQDLFDEGSFYGKGIYDVKVAHRVLNRRFQDNCLLSHDLIEGAYLRSGIAYDPALQERPPSTLLSDLARRHRWTRGDWQNLRWLLPRVLNQDGKTEKNPLSVLSRLKIVDNARRSIIPAACLGVLLVGDSVGRESGWPVPTFMLAIMFASTFFRFLLMTFRGDFRTIRSALSFLSLAILEKILWLAYLPVTATLQIDAIGRALYRMTWSRKDLLEWRTSAQVDKGPEALARYIQVFLPSTAIVGLVLLLNGLHSRPHAEGALLALLWAMAPLIAWMLDRRIEPPAGAAEWT